ncbi:MAG: FAD-binding oxidoreductase [Alphaproteobacteria bacterium]|nr:FAD-binding oxidoreductase [Alphaproteobacteria bacterium]MDP6564459.1 FAD-binding oxidoreductase [Alphaproteobacteria bacterium]
MERCDFVIVGAGIAGASAGYFLAAHGRVVVLEREDRPGYHSTGRSAALYSESYGNEVIRALTSGGREFFTNPPAGFAEHPLLSPRGALFVGRADQAQALDDTAAEAGQLVDSIARLDADGARAIVPALRQDYVDGAVSEPEAMDIDVDALHQGFLRGVRAKGGEIRTEAEVTALSHDGDGWSVTTSQDELRAPVLINAAGAWCDVIAGIAGLPGIGLVPKRRTVIQFAAPDDVDSTAWPLCVDVDENFFFKPDAGKLIGSPADETPMEPCDVQPDEYDIALAAHRVQEAADLPIPRIEHRWAGLRSFVADKTLVAGFDPAAEGFFWLAGQGGYGIQTSPSMGRITDALARGGGIPDDLAALGVTEAALSPARFR